MSMRGSRFGVGLAAGVLFALAVIVASGAVSSAPSSSHQAPSGGLASATATTSTLTTITGTVPAGVYTISGNQSSPGSQSGLSSLNSGSTSAANGQNSPSVPKFSSELAAMGQLSTPARALLLTPVIAALLIGALFYRSSLARRERKEDQVG